MICPKCKKKETSIVKELYESSTNTVKRQRECKCGNLFVTYEIDKLGLKSKPVKILRNSHQLKKSRRPSTKEEWIDFRVYLYGFTRMAAILTSSMSAMDKFDKKFKHGPDTFLGPTKFPNKKSFFSVYSRKKKDYSDVKIERVKQTIKRCVNTTIYWKYKKKFFKHIVIPDLKDKRVISDEINQYNRSITSYIRKDKYDTPDFFNTNSKYLDEMIQTAVVDKDVKFTKVELQKLKTDLFSTYIWDWYREVR